MKVRIPVKFVQFCKAGKASGLSLQSVTSTEAIMIWNGNVSLEQAVKLTWLSILVETKLKLDPSIIKVIAYMDTIQLGENFFIETPMKSSQEVEVYQRTE